MFTSHNQLSTPGHEQWWVTKSDVNTPAFGPNKSHPNHQVQLWLPVTVAATHDLQEVSAGMGRQHTSDRLLAPVI